MRGTNPNLMGQTSGVIGADGVVIDTERLVPRRFTDPSPEQEAYLRHLSGEGRRYLPTLADLVDRLSIVQMKAVFISEHSEEYRKERADIEHDIDLIIKEKKIQFNASSIHAILVIMLSNRFIWENESKVRAAESSDQDKLLKLTHSINGIRNTAKNQLAVVDGGRLDYKIDSLAADLPMEFGNWRIFE